MAMQTTQLNVNRAADAPDDVAKLGSINIKPESRSVRSLH
jgi:hypothetical protein